MCYTNQMLQLNVQTSSLPLQLFRKFFAICLIYDFSRHLYYNRAETWYIDPQFHYEWSYPINQIPHPTSIPQYQFHFFLTILLATLLFLGYPNVYRFTTVALFVLYGWFFTWDKSYYNNHYYLILLFLFHFIVVDASGNKKKTVPKWNLLLFKYQISRCTSVCYPSITQ